MSYRACTTKSLKDSNVSQLEMQTLQPDYMGSIPGCTILAVKLWESYLICLCPSGFLNKMGILCVLTS